MGPISKQKKLTATLNRIAVKYILNFKYKVLNSTKNVKNSEYHVVEALFLVCRKFFWRFNHHVWRKRQETVAGRRQTQKFDRNNAGCLMSSQSLQKLVVNILNSFSSSKSLVDCQLPVFGTRPWVYMRTKWLENGRRWTRNLTWWKNKTNVEQIYSNDSLKCISSL